LDLLKPSFTFTAEVIVLTHHTTIKPRYQPMIHCGNIRQSAHVLEIDKEVLRSGDKAVVKYVMHANSSTELAFYELFHHVTLSSDCHFHFFFFFSCFSRLRFQFLARQEFIRVGSKFVFREGNTKGIGNVLAVTMDGYHEKP
jgi:GTPase